jgi:hypothetical protein
MFWHSSILLEKEIEDESKFHEKPNQNVLGPGHAIRLCQFFFFFFSNWIRRGFTGGFFLLGKGVRRNAKMEWIFQ